ncbi:FMN-dependent NADH-azoreductase [Wenyingzhuangia sp. IMCC45533]
MKILKINSSANMQTSVSRKYVDVIASKIKDKHTDAKIIDRDVVNSNLPHLNGAMLDSFFADGERTQAQKDAVAVSDALVQELQEADVLVIGAPVYNFSIPATLKTYIDLIVRAGITFKYTENGPVGLLENKKTFIVVPSGGVAVGSEADFNTPYLKQILAFLGITDITIVPFDQLMMGAEDKIKSAEAQIENLDF